MDTFGTVNFEDLFDFSPEPLDSSSNQGPATSQQQQQQDPQQQQQQQLTPIVSQQPLEESSKLNSTPLSEIGGNSSFNVAIKSTPADNSSNAGKLSQSVPNNWGSHFPRQQQQQQDNSFTSNTSATSFNTSIGSLLEDLPEQSASTGQKGKRGRKPGQKNLKTDMKSKLERSRQSARECRARKKLRYQYLDDLILEREKAIFKLRDELNQYLKWCQEMDANQGVMPEGLKELMQKLESEKRGL